MSKTFRSPKGKGEIFSKNWNKLIQKVTNRENFHTGHLDHLEILCDLYQEYHDLSQIIKQEGFTFNSSGRYGDQCRIRPEVNQKNKVLQEIRHYSKILGLNISDEEKPEDVGNEWE